MDFPEFRFASMGETDVREEIVAPLLRHLGYRSSTINDVIREQPLSYPQLPLGRKKPHDPLVRGIADYLCIAKGQVNWTIEAKAPAVALDEDAQHQAWTYANHPEIRAALFVVTNGSEFKVYQTNRGAIAPPVTTWSYREMHKRMTEIENLLSPDAILRNHPPVEIDTGRPIGHGLRSIVRVTGGMFRYQQTSLPSEPLKQLIMTVTGGSIERRGSDHLEAHICTRSPFQQFQELKEKLGINSLLFISSGPELSLDPAFPTVFQAEIKVVFPEGEEVLNIENWQMYRMPRNVTALTRTRATGHLCGTTFSGRFESTITYIEIDKSFTTEGMFNLQLS